MSRIDVFWALRHPLRWAYAVGFHLFVAGLLTSKAVLITDPLFDVTRWAHIGPIVLMFAAGMVVASAVAPADRRLQIATAATLIGLASWRVFTYLLLIASDVSANTAVIAQAFILHWAWVGAIATRWPIISTKAALIVTVEAGRDQEPLRAAG